MCRQVGCLSVRGPAGTDTGLQLQLQLFALQLQLFFLRFLTTPTELAVLVIMPTIKAFFELPYFAVVASALLSSLLLCLSGLAGVCLLIACACGPRLVHLPTLQNLASKS